MSQSYSVGDAVKVLYYGTRGTTLTNAHVARIEATDRGGGGWMVTAVTHDSGLKVDTFVDRLGRSDYLLRGHLPSADASTLEQWARALSSEKLRASAARMRRFDVPAANPIRTAVVNELARRAQQALADITND